MAFLDETGLAYFLGKIKAWAADVFLEKTGTAASASDLASGSILSIAKGGTGSSEKNFVDLVSSQNVGGQKKFTSAILLSGDNGIWICQTGVDYAGYPASSQYSAICHVDANSKNLGRMLWWWNSSASGGSRGFSFDLSYVGSEAYKTAFSISLEADNKMYFSFSNLLTTVQPTSDAVSLGRNVANRRWAKIYAVDTTISTSDERAKTSIELVPDAVLDAWGDVDWVQFKMRDAVKSKGASSARLHSGLVAQRIGEAFRLHGLDASRYGLFCYDAWGAEAPVVASDGSEQIPGIEAGDAYSVRYAEALCMEAAFQRRRADRLEARLSALEARLKNLLGEGYAQEGANSH